MMLKIAVFAPIPSPSVISAARVNPGVRARRRSAYFKSRIESIIWPFLPLIARPDQQAPARGGKEFCCFQDFICDKLRPIDIYAQTPTDERKKSNQRQKLRENH